LNLICASYIEHISVGTSYISRAQAAILDSADNSSNTALAWVDVGELSIENSGEDDTVEER
jgi:hypothetical protein